MHWLATADGAANNREKLAAFRPGPCGDRGATGRRIMLMSNIGVVNYSRTPDSEVARWAAAAETQMRNDVGPVWHLPGPRLQLVAPNVPRSEERRVGKEGRAA